MSPYEQMATEKQREDRAKKAIALAMRSRWAEAVVANESILSDFPEDLEAWNRLGKALTEEGRVKAAKATFGQVLALSPHNAIARKNLDRLMQLEGEERPVSAGGGAARHAFIEERGKAAVTSLINLASRRALLKESPGHSVKLQLEGGGIKVLGLGGANLGQVEPRLASRLVRLTKGGNRYEAEVTSAGEQEISVIIREVYQHPSQAGAVSFPLKGSASNGVYLPNTILGYDQGDQAETAEPLAIKDWSNDDTEPGDDDAFSPVIHQIIGADGGVTEDDA